MKENSIKVFFTTIWSVMASVLGTLHIPVVLLVICNVVDYITGLMAAPYREDKVISSYKSMKGITKKIGMWLLVVVGVVMDQLILYAVATMGWTFPFTFLIGCIVSIWLICNETISILENLQDVGIEIPAFLMPLAKNIQKKAEGSVEVESEEE